MTGVNELTATEDRVENILTRQYQYSVPDYQRRYSWKEEQLAALWSDIQAIGENSAHFIGSFVLITRTGTISEMSKLEVVDGQQRLTTISLILAAIREKYYNIGESEKAKTIDEDYLWMGTIDQEKSQKLTLSLYDNPDYRSILCREFDNISDGKLKNGFEYYIEKLNDMSPDEVDYLRKRLLKGITAVSIETDGEQSAFKLFETLNDRGMELSSVDLMRNYTFSTAADSSDIDYEEVKDNWQNAIEYILPKMSKPSRFFRHYIMSCETPDYDGDVSNYKLYDIFQEIVEERLTSVDMTLEEYTEDIMEKASLYSSMLSKNVEKFSRSGNSDINEKLHDLELINTTQARTLILRILSDAETANEVMEQLLVLEAFAVRWKVSGFPTGGELDRTYSAACSKCFNSGKAADELKHLLTNRWPSDDEFRASLENQNLILNDRTDYILQKLEEEYYNGRSDSRDADTEHIAPRASFRAKKYSAWPSALNMTEGEFTQIRDYLGNLTLLEPELNASAGATSFDDKCKKYSQSDYEMTQKISNSNKRWDKEKIEKRTEVLARACTKIWSL